MFKLFGTEGSLVYFSSGSLGFLEERHPVSLRIGEVRYSSGNKFKVGLLTLNKNERKNSLNFVTDFPDFCFFVKHQKNRVVSRLIDRSAMLTKTRTFKHKHYSFALNSTVVSFILIEKHVWK